MREDVQGWSFQQGCKQSGLKGLLGSKLGIANVASKDDDVVISNPREYEGVLAAQIVSKRTTIRMFAP